MAARATGLFVIGWGRVGSALATQAKRAGVAIVGVETRDPARLKAARKAIGRGSDLSGAELVAIAVPDSALEKVASALAPRLRAGQVVFHCSGSLGLEPLRRVHDRRALAGSLHPYCSVASAATPLRGAACAIDGSPKARAALRRLATALGMRPLAAPPRDRIRYHLSAVLQVTAAGVAAASATRLLTRAGARPLEARQALAAILRSVAFNLEQDSPAAALTGPFARGDVARIRLQLAALEGDVDTLSLYRAIGTISAGLSPQLTPEQRAAVDALLQQA